MAQSFAKHGHNQKQQYMPVVHRNAFIQICFRVLPTLQSDICQSCCDRRDGLRTFLKRGKLILGSLAISGSRQAETPCANEILPVGAGSQFDVSQPCLMVTDLKLSQTQKKVRKNKAWSKPKRFLSLSYRCSKLSVAVHRLCQENVDPRRRWV